MSGPKHTRDEFGVLGEPRFVPRVPPRQSGGSERLTALAALLPSLRQRPHTWAAIMEGDNRHAPSNIVSSFRRGRFGPPTDWQTAVRRNAETGRHVLYVRYVGQVAKP